MKIIDRIDKQIRIIPKIKYVRVDYDIMDWEIIEMGAGAVEKIYNYVKTLPLKRSGTFTFSGQWISVYVHKGYERKLVDFIRDVARNEFSDILDQDDVRLMREYHESEIRGCVHGEIKVSKCPGFSASYNAVIQLPFVL